jgi:hypothetical protein
MWKPVRANSTAGADNRPKATSATKRARSRVGDINILPIQDTTAASIMDRFVEPGYYREPTIPGMAVGADFRKRVYRSSGKMTG